MLLKEALLTLALTFPAPWHPPGEEKETQVQYHERLATIAEAIALEAEVAKPLPEGENALAAATLVLWQGESRFELAVHTNVGKTRWGQDDGRARCLGQLHASGLVPKEEWEKLAGADLESTRRCAKATMRMLSAQYWVCRRRAGSGGRIARMYEGYATGRSCEPRQRSESRAHRWRRVTQEVWVLMRPEAGKEEKGSPRDRPSDQEPARGQQTLLDGHFARGARRTGFA